jgi:hypothetical protein
MVQRADADARKNEPTDSLLDDDQRFQTALADADAMIADEMRQFRERRRRALAVELLRLRAA